ncbi:hypothetical protein HanXRQr2_Chr13g0568751 [Helianthus annuus]|uniref:Uncharacterized protein n=1 Tax=Helianthus annuus TaxID=4232 RepID=A0A9K3EE04_HELAN|nr:hypothetical protein HanXRQr2_Chr13g0568751 [Helianthus annuus]KAJ0496302.1 hypothetical protein HanHA89_Chr13g0498111 [Helianthus annuus]
MHRQPESEFRPSSGATFLTDELSHPNIQPSPFKPPLPSTGTTTTTTVRWWCDGGDRDRRERDETEREEERAMRERKRWSAQPSTATELVTVVHGGSGTSDDTSFSEFHRCGSGRSTTWQRWWRCSVFVQVLV